MRAFVDETTTIDEPSDARMSFRTKKRIKNTIQRAAALSGVDDTTFAVSAAYREAKNTINAHERTVLQPVDHEKFFAALDAPAKPIPALVDAIKRYHTRVVAR
ncbi:hypothetical protein TW83_17930 [Paracoccus sp. S4493]|uniref:type II toxin-antitoxin system TacA family antitoxin n=1 Tax=Paracoccus sp. S4493 TaxID=579490 RepID=UPI0005F9DEA1|nr:DUF1778 domain-containing protein [Paracoccus sp. S4493]KJZ28320.1 hypothetical protein TW83_17930 [Paracoccus sp. S4493]